MPNYFPLTFPGSQETLPGTPKHSLNWGGMINEPKAPETHAARFSEAMLLISVWFG